MSAANLCIGAIDPGGSGAVAFLFTGFPNTVASEDMPTAAGDVDIERVGAMPKQGVSSTFKFGKAYGIAIGVVAALKIPVHFVTPAAWKRHFNLSADKEASRARALQLWPARADLFARKRDHNRAEAALLARYAAERIVNGGGGQ
jgi:crossover junction endodeoxyribonuclease RuvC